MEEVLSTIVDAITNVLLVFEEAERTTKKKLSVKETEQLEKAILILVDLAGKAAATYTDEFKNKMQVVIDDMKKSGEVMRNYGAKTVETGDHKVLLEETKKLLIYAVSMLKIQDEARVKLIVTNGKAAIEMVRRAYNTNLVKELLSVAPDLNEQILNVMTLLQRRLNSISNPALTKSLKDSMEAIKVGNAEIIVKSRAAIEAKGDPEKDKERKVVFTNLLEALSQAMSAVARSASLLQAFDIEYFYPGGGGYRRPIDGELLDRIRGLRLNIASALNNLKIPNKDKNEATAQIKLMASKIQEQISLGRELADKIDDPARKQALMDACDELEKLLPQFVRAARDHFANPDDKRLEAEYLMLADRVAAASAQIQLATVTASLDQNIQKMFDALNIGDDQGAREAAQKAVKDMNEIVSVAKEIASRISNPVHKQKILTAISQLEKLIPKFMPAVETVIKNPDDAQAKQALGKLVQEVQITTGVINDLSMRPLNNPELVTLNDLPQRATAEEKEVIKTGISLSENLDNLALAVRVGDSEQIKNTALEVGKDAKALIIHGRKVEAECEDKALKSELHNQLDTFEVTSKDLLMSAATLAQNPKDAKQKKKVEDLIDKTREEGGKVSKVVKKIAEAREVEAKKAIKPIDSRVPKDMADALEQVLLAANASQLPDDSPQGQLVATSRLIAEELEKLSIATDKVTMINAARKIADSIANVMKLATEIASKCKNQKLRDALLNVAPVPKNFSTQLKILAAVKSAISSDDKTANIQLFDCAKRLANSVVSVINSSEAAALASL